MQEQIEKTKDNNIKNLFFIYELNQIQELERFWDEHPKMKADSRIIAFSLEIEERLRKHGILFSSLRSYKHLIPDQLVIEDKIIHTFFNDQRWEKFQYRGVALLKTFEFMFRSYFQTIWYFGNIFISIVQNNPSVTRFILFKPSEIITSTYGYLAKREIYAVIDCAKVVAVLRGISVEVLPLSFSVSFLRSFIRPMVFSMQRWLFTFFLKIWNTGIILMRRPLRPRLIISDYWKNIGPTIEYLKKAECIFLDRAQIQNINWRFLFKYRMRFMHSRNFLTQSMRRRAKKNTKTFIEMWNTMRGTLKPAFIRYEYSFDPLLIYAIDDIVNKFEKILQEIEGTHAMYKKLQPDAVLLRASVSGQTHFSILPLIAREYSIPAIELQHGLEYLGPGSWSRDHNAEYIAVYGPLIKNELSSIGYLPEKIKEVGSPRFDSYRIDEGKKREGNRKLFTVLCIVPDIRAFEIYDTYSAENYLNAVAKAVSFISEAHIIIKLRPHPAHEILLRTIIKREFSHLFYSIAQHEALLDLYTQADMVISCFSTAVLEAMQCGLPVVIPALNPIDASMVKFHFKTYEKNHALMIALNEEEFSKKITALAAHSEIRYEVSKNAQAFIEQNFCFDGNASRRYADFITKITHT